MDDLSQLAGIMQGVAALGQPGWQAIADEATYRNTKKMAEWQNQKQLEWWNLQNNYNTPAAQMQRMADAGLSPNLMYGQLSSSKAGDVGTPVAAAKQFNANLPGAMMQAVTGFLSMLSQAEGVKRQQLENEKLDAELHFGGFGASGNDEALSMDSLLEFLKNPSLGSYRDYIRYKRIYDLVNEQYNTDYNASRPQYLDTQIEGARTANRFAEDSFNARIENLLEDLGIKRQNWLRMDIENDFLRSEKSLGILGQILRMLGSIFGR